MNHSLTIVLSLTGIAWIVVYAHSEVNSKAGPKARIVKDYVPPKTGWGDPQISGAHTNSDESGIPFERPTQCEGRRLQDITPEELANIVTQRQEQTVERAPTLSSFPGTTSPLHWFENHQAANSRAWLVSDPPDGHVPPSTPEAQARAAARAWERAGHGPADGPEDRSLYDRCITREIPGSMMPAIYGNSYAIYQGPGYVAIRYEMVNETRIIPLTARPHVSPRVRQYWATRAAIGTATRSSSRRRTSTTRPPIAGRAINSGSSSASSPWARTRWSGP